MKKATREEILPPKGFDRGQLQFSRLEIPDVILVKPKVFGDSRGFFFENYNRHVFTAHGIAEEFVQDNYSKSSLGVLRGLHYQIEPRAQAKLIRVIRGKVFDVVVDIRKGSKTFGKYVSGILSAESMQSLYIPAGFAHGFCVLEDETEFVYKVSDYYSPEHERGIFWNDRTLAIPWPPLRVDYILSDRDQKHPPFKTVFPD